MYVCMYRILSVYGHSEDDGLLKRVRRARTSQSVPGLTKL